MFNKKTFKFLLLVLGILFTFWYSQYAAAQESGSSIVSTTNSAPLIGSPFNISTGSIDEVLPAVAYNPVDQEYLVVWENIRSGQNDIYAQRISEQGNFLSWFAVADGENPAVAYNPKNNTYLVVYERYIGSDYDVYAQRVDFTGLLGAEFAVASNLDETEHSPAVTYNTHPNHDEFLVIWENIPPPPTIINKVEGWRVAGTACVGLGCIETIGGRIDIATDGNYYSEPDLAYNLNMNEYLIVFTRLPSGGGSYDVYARRVTSGGDPLPGILPIDSSGGDQYNPAVAAYRLNQATPYLVVFTDTWNDTAGDVRGYLVNQQGQPMQLINIAATSGEREFDPTIAESESWGGYFVSWIQGPTSNTDIFGIQVSNTGLTHPEFDISGSATTPLACDRTLPDIAVGHSTALAVWTDPCGSAGGQDILGRFLGYKVNLPLVIR